MFDLRRDAAEMQRRRTIGGPIVCLMIHLPAEAATVSFTSRLVHAAAHVQSRGLERATDPAAVWQQIPVLFCVSGDFSGCQIPSWSVAVEVGRVCSRFLRVFASSVAAE